HEFSYLLLRNVTHTVPIRDATVLDELVGSEKAGHYEDESGLKKCWDGKHEIERVSLGDYAMDKLRGAEMTKHGFIDNPTWSQHTQNEDGQAGSRHSGGRKRMRANVQAQHHQMAAEVAAPYITRTSRARQRAPYTPSEYDLILKQR
ncbi:hypothetical protein STEG23_010606, partial [Scotinomys teguina]